MYQLWCFSTIETCEACRSLSTSLATEALIGFTIMGIIKHRQSSSGFAHSKAKNHLRLHEIFSTLHIACSSFANGAFQQSLSNLHPHFLCSSNIFRRHTCTRFANGASNPQSLGPSSVFSISLSHQLPEFRILNQ